MAEYKDILSKKITAELVEDLIMIRRRLGDDVSMVRLILLEIFTRMENREEIQVIEHLSASDLMKYASKTIAAANFFGDNENR